MEKLYNQRQAGSGPGLGSGCWSAGLAVDTAVPYVRQILLLTVPDRRHHRCSDAVITV